MKLTRSEESSPACATYTKKETIAACKNIELQGFTTTMINRRTKQEKNLIKIKHTRYVA